MAILVSTVIDIVIIEYAFQYTLTHYSLRKLAFVIAILFMDTDGIIGRLNSRAALRARVSPKDGTVVNLSSLRSDGTPRSPAPYRLTSSAMQVSRAAYSVRSAIADASDSSRSS